MLSKEEEATLEQYVANIEMLPREVATEYITLPIIDILWLIEKLKDTNEYCKEKHTEKYKRLPMGILK